MKIIKNKKMFIWSTIFLIFIIGIIVYFYDKHELVLKTDTVEYGSDLSKITLFEYTNSSEKPQLSFEIDSKEIGTYKVEAVINNQKLTKEITVKDSKNPSIELIQKNEKIYEIPYGSDFNIVGNIKMVSDEIDGEIDNLDVVTYEDYEKAKEDISKYKSDLEKRYFQNKEDIDNIKKTERYRNKYSLVSSDIDTHKAGEYEIRIMAIDYNYNIIEKIYKVNVVKEGQEVQKDNLAVGVEGTSLSEITTKYKIEDKTKIKEKKDTTQTTKSTVDIVTENPKSVSVSNDVAKAALARVGQKMWCDELCSQALVDAGVLTGDNSIFPDDFLTLSCYKPIGKKISKSQLKPGDILYYDNAGSGKKHVAVYVGNNKAVHGGSSGGKVVLGRVGIGDGPSQYLRMPSHFTWNDALKMVFGFTQNDIENGNISNEGGKNENIDVYTERNVTKDGQDFTIKGKNINVDSLDNMINQFMAGKINSDTFVKNVKGLGCSIDVSGEVANPDTWYELKFSTDQGNYVIKGTNVSNSTRQSLDDIMLEFMFDNIDESTFISKVKALGCTVTKG